MGRTRGGQAACHEGNKIEFRDQIGLTHVLL